MPSYSAPPRRVPQQYRGQKRVSTLLKAASEVLAEKGYEAATMSEIAERAEAAIGSLYQFFPNKESLVCALQTACGEDIENLWAPLLEPKPGFSLNHALSRVVEATVHYIDTHPVVVALQQAPNTTWNHTIRRRLELRIANFFRAANPQLSRAAAASYGAVCMQLIKACSQQYLQTRKNRKQIMCEYQIVLRCYAELRAGRE